MGTQHILLARPGIRRRRASFRRLFIWYCIGIIAVTFIVTCALELSLILAIGVAIERRQLFEHNLPLQF